MPGNSIASSRSIPPQAGEATALLHARFGGALAAVYLYGSFVAGGLRPASDLDLLAVLRRPITDEERTWLLSDLLARSSPPGDPVRRALELTCVVLDGIQPWRHPAVRELQFGEWLRADLEAGRMPGREPDPDLALLLAQARSHGIALLGPPPAALLPAIPAADIRAAVHALLPGLAARLEGEEQHALLTLARMWVTLHDGRIVPKDVAADLVAPQLPVELAPALLHARDAYRGMVADDWRGWTGAVQRCAAHMSGVLSRMPAAIASA